MAPQGQAVASGPARRLNHRSTGSENNCGSDRTWDVRSSETGCFVAEQLDMGCEILRDRVFRDAEVLARVLYCRHAQVRTSFAHLDHMGDGEGGCVGKSTRAVASAFASKPQLPPNSKKCPREQAGNKKTQPCCCHRQKGARPPVLSPVRKNKTQIRSLGSVMTIDNQRSAPDSAALRRSGATDAPVKTTLHKCCDTNMRRRNSE